MLDFDKQTYTRTYASANNNHIRRKPANVNVVAKRKVWRLLYDAIFISVINANAVFIVWTGVLIQLFQRYGIIIIDATNWNTP